MSNTQRIGVWFGQGLENALAARAALGKLQAEYPGADWVLFGPRESLFLFEMDDRVPVYIPLRALEPRRAAQTRLSFYLEKRAQFKKLRRLQLHLCFGVAVLSSGAEQRQQAAEQFQRALKMISTSGQWIEQEISLFMQEKRPLLQAGPQSLAFATQLHRHTPPHLGKLLVLLDGVEIIALENQLLSAQSLIKSEEAMHATVAVITTGDRLASRRLNALHSDWLQTSVAQAMGLIAYADRVICFSPAVTLVCQEMGRADRLLLVKSNK